jgi:hypothetical protein
LRWLQSKARLHKRTGPSQNRLTRALSSCGCISDDEACFVTRRCYCFRNFVCLEISVALSGTNRATVCHFLRALRPGLRYNTASSGDCAVQVQVQALCVSSALSESKQSVGGPGCKSAERQAGRASGMQPTTDACGKALGREGVGCGLDPAAATKGEGQDALICTRRKRLLSRGNRWKDRPSATAAK